MQEKYKTLVKRREELVAQSALQREQLTGVLSDMWQPGTYLVGKNILLQARKWPFVSGLLAILSVLFFRNRRLFSVLAVSAMSLRVWAQLLPYALPVMKALKRLSQKGIRKGREKVAR